MSSMERRKRHRLDVIRLQLHRQKLALLEKFPPPYTEEQMETCTKEQFFEMDEYKRLHRPLIYVPREDASLGMRGISDLECISLDGPSEPATDSDWEYFQKRREERLARRRMKDEKREKFREKLRNERILKLVLEWKNGAGRVKTDLRDRLEG